MKIKLKLLMALAFILASIPITGTIALADDTTFYPYSDSYIDEGNPTDNDGSSTWLYLSNYGEWDQRERAVFKIDDQSGGGTVTSVILKLWYGGYWEIDPDGLDVRVYRLTKTFDENYVSWDKRTQSGSWTTGGGDYTSTAYAQAELHDPEDWISWNITTMALYEWNQSDDLYVLVRWRYENKTIDTTTIAYFRSSEGPSAYRPQVIVTFEEEAQIPDVSSDVDAYGDLWVDLQINPTLYDWTTATVYAQASLAGQSTWAYESSGEAITNDDPVVERITGLTEGTAYDVRAKLVYDTSEVVYSTPEEFTTVNYALPNFDSSHSSVGLHSATLTGSWTGNTDSKSVDVRMWWKLASSGIWEYEEWKEGSTTTGSKDWTIYDLYGNHDYDYKVEFDIDGHKWWVDTAQFTTGQQPDLTVTIHDKALEFVEIKIVYDCKDATDADIWARVQADGSSQWLTSTKDQGNSGQGSLYFTIDDLEGGTLYEYQGIVEAEGITGTFGNQYFWTEDLETLPTIGDITSQFDRPHRLRLGVDGTLGDAAMFDPTFTVMLKESGTTTWFSAGRIDITTDGFWYIDVVCGDLVKWDTSYTFYGILDYTVGTLETDQDGLHVPTTPQDIVTLAPAFVADDAMVMRMYVQIDPELGPVDARFEWWVQGDSHKYTTDWMEITTTGVYEWCVGCFVTVSPMRYGVTYCYQAYLGNAGLYADEVICARCGYWTDPDPGDDDDDDGWFPWVPEDVLPHSFPITAAKAIFALVCTVAAGGLVMWKLRGRSGSIVALVAMLGSVLIFGMIRFIPLWFILLLAMVIGLGFLYVIKSGFSGARE